MLVEITYELYNKIKHLDGVEKINLEHEYILNQANFVLDCLGVTDEDARNEILDAVLETFEDDVDMLNRIKRFIKDNFEEIL